LWGCPRQTCGFCGV